MSLDSLISFFLGISPIIWLVIALSILKRTALFATSTALLIVVLLSIFNWNLPFVKVLLAGLEGIAISVWPIGIVIIAALFAYNITVFSGSMDKIQSMLSSISSDPRVQLLLIVWGFGNFMEGMAGFGTAVAIPAAILVGLGINPIKAVACCLVANTTPTAFGSVAVPLVTLSSITGIPMEELTNHTVDIQCLVTFLLPCGMLWVYDGFRAYKGFILQLLVADIAFVLPWYCTAKFISGELPDIIGGLCVLVIVSLMSKIKATDNKAKFEMSFVQCLKAWAPFGLVVVFLSTVALCRPLQDVLNIAQTQLFIYPDEIASKLTFKWVNTPGVLILLASIIGGCIQGVCKNDLLKVFRNTIFGYWRALLTICVVLALARIMFYSGMIQDVATTLIALTGQYYPLVAPIIGGVGGFITGSGTSTNVLFGALQAETAMKLGLNPSWIASSNILGAGIGKMICPQSIAIGVGAVKATGSESIIFKKVLGWYIFLIIIASLCCYLGTI